MGVAGPKNPDTWSCSQTWLRQKTQQTISSGHAPVVDSLGGSQRDHLRPGCVSGARGKPLQQPGGGPVLQLRKRTSWAGLAPKGCRRQNRRLLFCALFTARLRPHYYMQTSVRKWICASCSAQVGSVSVAQRNCRWKLLGARCSVQVLRAEEPLVTLFGNGLPGIEVKLAWP